MKGDWVKVNLNQRVRVVLTRRGQLDLQDRYNRAACDALYPGWYGGVIEMSLWELFGIFGTSLKFSGTNTPFESNNIEIQEGIL